jgi:hypothetical protein
MKSVRKCSRKNEAARCLETEIFVIIFIALFLDCDKKLNCVRKRSRENALARCSETKLKHQN